MNANHEEPGSGTTRRVLLTVLIVGGVVAFMVLPWVFLFHSPTPPRRP